MDGQFFGLRARAQDLVTQELGQRNDIEIQRALTCRLRIR